MFQGHTIAVVIPALNEEAAIAETIVSVPSWVDRVIVVDDASTDATAAIANHATCQTHPDEGQRFPSHIELIRHPINHGVGAAIVTGYKRAVAAGIDITVVMAGDGQMDPADLPSLITPIVSGSFDYVKGNRFLHNDIWRTMPPARLFGNIILSLATKLTSGYHGLFDSQCGFTAISYDTLTRLELDRVFARYGYPNDVLARLHTIGARVRDVRVRPVYGPRWKSGIRPATVVYPISYVLLRSFFSRLAKEQQGLGRLEGTSWLSTKLSKRVR